MTTKNQREELADRERRIHDQIQELKEKQTAALAKARELRDRVILADAPAGKLEAAIEGEAAARHEAATIERAIEARQGLLAEVRAELAEAAEPAAREVGRAIRAAERAAIEGLAEVVRTALEGEEASKGLVQQLGLARARARAATVASRVSGIGFATGPLDAQLEAALVETVRAWVKRVTRSGALDAELDAKTRAAIQESVS